MVKLRSSPEDEGTAAVVRNTPYKVNMDEERIQVSDIAGGTDFDRAVPRFQSRRNRKKRNGSKGVRGYQGV